MFTFVQRLLARYSIRTKLWFGFGTLVAILAVVVLTTVFSLTATRGNMAEVVQRVQPMALDSLELTTRLEHTSASLGFYLLSKEPRQRDDYLHNLQQVNELVQSLQRQPLLREDAALAARVGAVADKVQRFASYRERMLQLAEDDGANFPAMQYAGMNVNPLMPAGIAVAVANDHGGGGRGGDRPAQAVAAAARRAALCLDQCDERHPRLSRLSRRRRPR